MLKLRIDGPFKAKLVSHPVPGPQAEVWRDSSGQVAAYAEIIDQEYWMHLPGLASFRFSERDDEIAATLTEEVTEEAVLDAYRRKVLPIALQVRGWEVLHASAVSSEAGVTALCGISETGKSTIAFALSRRGYRLWADDAVPFEINGHGPLAMSLPFTSRLRHPASEFFSQDPHHSTCKIDSTAIETAPLRAVSILRREENSQTSVRRLASTQALTALLDHAFCFSRQPVERKRLMIEHYLNMVTQIPIYDVCFPPGLENLSTVLDTIERLMSETVKDGGPTDQVNFES